MKPQVAAPSTHVWKCLKALIRRLVKHNSLEPGRLMPAHVSVADGAVCPGTWERETIQSVKEYGDINPDVARILGKAGWLIVTHAGMMQLNPDGSLSPVKG